MKELVCLLNSIEEAIEQMEADDTAYLRYYTVLIKKRRALKRMIKRFERLEKKQ